MNFYLTEDDYLAVCEARDLDTLTAGNPTLLDNATTTAVGVASSYLRSGYDVAAGFARRGAARDPAMVGALVAIALHSLHQLITPRQVPEVRADEKAVAIRWLEQCAKGEVVPDFPVLETGRLTGGVAFGSNAKLDHDY